MAILRERWLLVQYLGGEGRVVLVAAKEPQLGAVRRQPRRSLDVTQGWFKKLDSLALVLIQTHPNRQLMGGSRTIEVVIFLEGRGLLARANSSVSGGFASAFAKLSGIFRACWEGFRFLKKRNFRE